MTSTAEHLGFAIFILPGSLVIIAILLWFFPFTALASLLRGTQVNLENDPEYGFNEIADFLIVLMGIYLLYQVISDASYWIMILQFTSAGSYPVEITPDQKASIGTTVIEAVMAVCLILGRKGIVKFIKSLRFGGT